MINGIVVSLMAINTASLGLLGTSALIWKGTDQEQTANTAVMATQLVALCGELELRNIVKCNMEHLSHAAYSLLNIAACLFFRFTIKYNLFVRN